MQTLLAFAAILAFDPVEDFKMPCMLVSGGWEYYTKLQIMVFFPVVIAIAMSLASFTVHVVRAHFKHRRDSKKIIETWAVKVMRKRRDSGIAGVADENIDSLARRASYRLKMKGSARAALETCVSLICMVYVNGCPLLYSYTIELR